MNGLVIGTSVIAAALAPLVVLFVGAPPVAGNVALIVSKPWSKSAVQVISDAQLQEVGPERAPIGAFVELRDNMSVAQLYQKGAWFVIDGRRILELCSS
ncbi:hypothetical protein [Arenibacterium sp. LLYu02]|uniref:hypothetical protein n=1 Tax=Arenibacterium sp. LLYu02 TaxID=3404132 RepID=UPI003B228DB8